MKQYLVEASDGTELITSFEDLAKMHFEHKKRKTRVRMWLIDNGKRKIISSSHDDGSKS